jgi:hypothetical protein
LYQFDSVWTWGNPLLAPPKSDAAVFETFVFFKTMATVVQRNFWRTRRGWLRMLGHLNINEDHLIEIALLDREAKLLDMNPAKYIANRIRQSVSTVYRYLELIDMTIAAEVLPTDFGEKSNFVPLDSVDTSYKPSPEEIQRKRLSVPRICAAGMPGCVGTSISGNYPLCTVCAKHFPMDKQDTWAAHTKLWLLPEIRRIEAEHRQQVVNLLYEEHYGMVDKDVFEYAEYAVSGEAH